MQASNILNHLTIPDLVCEYIQQAGETWFIGTTRGEERGHWRNQNPSRKNGGLKEPKLMKKKRPKTADDCDYGYE